jgi:hypothetical protein
MSCNATDYYRRLSPILERLEVLTCLAPVSDSDEQTAWTLSVLLSIAGDYVAQARRVLNDLATTDAEEGEPA